MNTEDIRKICARKKLAETSPNTVRFDVELKREETKIDIQKKRMLGDVLREKEKLLNEFVQINVKTPEIRPFLSPSVTPIGRRSSSLRRSSRNYNETATINVVAGSNDRSTVEHVSDSAEDHNNMPLIRRGSSLRRPVRKAHVVVPLPDPPIECHGMSSARDDSASPHADRTGFRRSASLKSRITRPPSNDDRTKPEVRRSSSFRTNDHPGSHIRSSSVTRSSLIQDSNVMNSSELPPFSRNSPNRGSGGARPNTIYGGRQSMPIPIIKLDGSSAIMFPNDSAHTGRRVMLSARVSTRMRKADAIMKTLNVVRPPNGVTRAHITGEVETESEVEEIKPVYF